MLDAENHIGVRFVFVAPPSASKRSLRFDATILKKLPNEAHSVALAVSDPSGRALGRRILYGDQQAVEFHITMAMK